MNNCWLCDCPLDEDEVQYCTNCELNMAQEMLAQMEGAAQAE
jgi:hypothetical protein